MGEQSYSCALGVIWEVGVQRQDPVALPPGKKRRTHRTGGWMGPRTSLHGSGETRFAGIFFFLHYRVLCTSSVLVLHFALLSVLTTYNTNIHNPGGIRTRNPSERSAAYRRLKPLGHWDRVDPRTVQLVTSHYTD